MRYWWASGEILVRCWWDTAEILVRYCWDTGEILWKTWQDARQFSKTSFSLFIWYDIRLLCLQVSFQEALENMAGCSSTFKNEFFVLYMVWHSITLPADFFSRYVKTHDRMLTRFMQKIVLGSISLLCLQISFQGTLKHMTEYSQIVWNKI